MKTTTSVLRFFVILFSCNVTLAKTDVQLPPNYMVCSKSAPTTERNKCLKANLKGLIISLKDGFTPLEIPRIEPYSMSSVRFKYDDPSLSFDLTFKNMQIHGVTGIDIKSVRSKFDEPKILIEAKVFYPKLRITSEYAGSANVGQVQIQPKGNLEVTLIDMSNTYKVTAMIEEKNNDEYVVLKKFDLTAIDIKDFKSKINGLVPDPLVNNFILEFINQNWRNLYPLIVKRTKPTWEPIVLSRLNDVYERIPYKQLLSE